jgi:hypothetical protein
MATPAQELYKILEDEVRTPKETTLLDAFLPPAGAIPSAFAAPPTPAGEQAPAGATLSQLLGRTPGEEPEPAAAAPKRRPARKKQEKQKSIEEEIAEFMSRDHSALAPDKDP